MNYRELKLFFKIFFSQVKFYLSDIFKKTKQKARKANECRALRGFIYY